jgi:hypothetical protein
MEKIIPPATPTRFMKIASQSLFAVACVMGAASVNLPTLVLSGGPMLVGRFKGKKIGTSDIWRFAEDFKLGKLSQEEFIEAEAAMSRSVGHCAPMGTASTMAAMVEALGLALPDNATIPAADSRRKVMAHMAGMRIVEMVREDLTMDKILTRKAFENSMLEKGTSVVEIVSTCNAGWKLSPSEANDWMVQNMFPAYPLGDLKNI